MNRRQNPISPLLALLFGAAVGIIFGLFYAPKTGEDTRDAILEKGSELKDSAAQKIEDLRDHI
jgi:gas vesicle protein